MTVALQGAYGKPRPAVVIQSTLYAQHSSVTILPLTSEDVPAPRLRVEISATAVNGLARDSFVMIDKAQTVPREKVGHVIGRLSAVEMRSVDQVLIVFLGLAS